MMKTNDGANATGGGEHPAPESAGRVPTTATVWTTGPGVTWPRATALRNWAPVIQW